jgi:hypothetical protein
MAIDLSVAVANAKADAFAAVVDGGSGPATLEIRSGSKPASCAAADSGDLLAEFTLADPAFGAGAVSGLLTAAAISPVNALMSGTAGHFRVKDSDGECHLQGTVTDGSGNGDLKLVTTAVVEDQPVQITSFTYQETYQSS